MSEKFKFTVGGVELSLSRRDVEERLKGVEAESIREVSVEVNGKQYPVKQAFAEATGLLRGNFTTHQAMRVFRKLALPLIGSLGSAPRQSLGLAVFENTEEMTCPACNKPFTFKPLSAAQIQLEGCSCQPPQELIEIPRGALLTDLGGLWVVRIPRGQSQAASDR